MTNEEDSSNWAYFIYNRALANEQDACEATQS